MHILAAKRQPNRSGGEGKPSEGAWGSEAAAGFKAERQAQKKADAGEVVRVRGARQGGSCR